MRIAFVHPSLGLGGAERLVADAAYVLTQRGHDVTVFTTRFDTTHTFDEFGSGAVRVRVRGDFLPASVAGRLRAPANILRTGYAALRATLGERYDVVFVDLVAHVLTAIRAVSRARIVYYCHFPDVLLTTLSARRTLGYRLYRWPLDRAEAHSLNAAHLLLANSAFTASVLRETFPGVTAPVEVLSPGVDVARYRQRDFGRRADDDIILLSLARYVPEKGLPLALEALAALRSRLPVETFRRLRLIFAGALRPEDVGACETHSLLAARARELGLSQQVELRISISDDEKLALLQRARALLYTPQREHFGIAPLEAMACGTPVIAVASGGPCETVVDGQTGYLCAPTALEFAERMANLVLDEDLAARMGAAAAIHAGENLSREAFTRRLERALASA